MGVPAIIVHGGAGKWSFVFNILKQYGYDISESQVLKAIREAAQTGYNVLESGGNAVDAITEAIKFMENSGYFNAGIASSLDANGNITMDAGIMDASTGEAVGVACVKYPKNPILLARYLLGKTDHIIIGCDTADIIARKIGLEEHPGPHPRALAFHKWAIEKMKKRDWKGLWRKNTNIAELLGIVADTVGAVAIDKEGNIAAGVSTGGVAFKIPGRIGDSPIPGAGYYAVRGVGGAAATGKGEYIILSQLTARAIDYLKNSLAPSEASSRAISYMHELTRGKAGIIIIDKDGRFGVAFNTEAMPWAYKSRDELHYGLWKPIQD